jgi:hypothetical protein
MDMHDIRLGKSFPDLASEVWMPREASFRRPDKGQANTFFLKIFRKARVFAGSKGRQHFD